MLFAAKMRKILKRILLFLRFLRFFAAAFSWFLVL